jgi:hypothetical protein
MTRLECQFSGLGLERDRGTLLSPWADVHTDVMAGRTHTDNRHMGASMVLGSSEVELRCLLDQTQIWE